MCFLLSAGTSEPIPRSNWRKEAPCIYVKSLIEYDKTIKVHFTSPEVQ
jgi:hypothetical protein